MEERRKFVRLDTRLEVGYAVLPSGTHERSVTKDIGGGGICLFTKDVLPRGTKIQVAMKLPRSEEPVNFIAEVIWSESYEMIGKTERRRSVETGVRFLEIAPKDQEAVLQHVILNMHSRQ